MQNTILNNLIALTEKALKAIPKALRKRKWYKELTQVALEARGEFDFVDTRAELKARYVDYAQDNLEQEGEIEFDDDAEVSLSDDGGAYVQAWVWVPAGGAGMCNGQDCHEPLDDGEGFDGKCVNCISNRAR